MPRSQSPMIEGCTGPNPRMLELRSAFKMLSLLRLPRETTIARPLLSSALQLRVTRNPPTSLAYGICTLLSPTTAAAHGRPPTRLLLIRYSAVVSGTAGGAIRAAAHRGFTTLTLLREGARWSG